MCIRDSARIDPAELKPVLMDFLNEDTICADAAHVVMRMIPGSAFDLLVPLLKKPRSGLRWWICGLLMTSGDRRAVTALIEVLQTDEDPGVRLVATNGLGEFRDPAALPALRQAAENDKGEDWEGRTVADAARDAIERITTPPKPRWT